MAVYSENAFQLWYRGHAKRQGLNEDPDNPRHWYDYRGAYKAGAGPDESGHWPSKFKRRGHPTEYIGGKSTVTGEESD